MKLTGAETRLLEAHLERSLFKKQERTYHDGQKVVVHKAQVIDPLINAIPAYSDMANAQDHVKRVNRRYLGSVDMITAQNWAKECGSAVGTKEFSAYAKKKLMNNEFAKFKAPKAPKVYF